MAGPSRKVCAQEVAGKFPTNLKQHLKKYHALQYEEVVKLEAEAKKRLREGGKKEKKGELVKGQATLQQAFKGRSAYGKPVTAIASFPRSLHCSLVVPTYLFA